MIWNTLVHSIITLVDLLALMTCIGALGFRLWVLPPTVKTMDSLNSRVILTSLWQMLAVSIALIFLSSAVLLVVRSSEMSGFPVMAVFPVLPTVLLKTHFGHAWLVRVLALVALCSLWWRDRERLDTLTISALMLIAGGVIALTRSATGHAADEGDLGLPELIDWLHLIAASFWGGGLIVLSSLLLLMRVKPKGKQASLFAQIAMRFSSMAGFALATIVATGAYNAWLQVGSFHYLWETFYGQTLIVKILLLIVLVVLGASNRYINIPLLRNRVDCTFASRGLLNKFFFPKYFHTGGHEPDRAQVAYWFSRIVKLEAILILAVLVCTALLIHDVPARHFNPTHSEHGMEKSMIVK